MSLSLDTLLAAAAANPKIWPMFEEMLGGPQQIALLLAKGVSENSTATISAEVVARLFDIGKSAAYDKISKAAISQKSENTRQ